MLLVKRLTSFESPPFPMVLSLNMRKSVAFVKRTFVNHYEVIRK